MATTYVLPSAEPVGVGLRRVVAEQLADAAGGLREAAASTSADAGEAVHDARKSVKKVRAVLRLVRPHLTKKVYRGETDALRSAAHLLGPARDAEVLADLLHGLLGTPDAPASLNTAALALRARAEAATALVVHGDGELAARTLDASAARLDEVLDGLPVGADAADLEPLAEGLETLQGKERKRRKKALAALDALGDADEPADDGAQAETDELLHDWRKRVKDLWYAERLLSERRADSSERDRLDALADALGADHDAAVLLEMLRATDGDGELPDGIAAVLATSLDDEARAALPGLLQAHRLPHRQQVRDLSR